MMNHLKCILRFYSGWRLPVVLLALVFGYVGLATDRAWSPLLAIAGAVPILLLYALTATRVGDHDSLISDHELRVAASESRLGHAEERDSSFENQFAAANKRIRRAADAAVKAEALRPAIAPIGPTTAPIKNKSVATGQVMSLYNIATASSLGPDAAVVTVVIPCFNEARFVGDAIQSLKEQTFRNFVGIVVDDASTDDSVAAAFAAIGGDSRFHVVRHAINSGLSAGRNTGLRLAQTAYVCFLDADDFFHVDNLEERVRNLVGHHGSPEVVGVYSGVEHADEHIHFGEAGFSSPAAHRSNFHDHLSSAGSCPFNCHAPLLRTEVLQRFGGFDESMRHGAEDWECWQRIMRHGYTFASTPSILAIYRQKAGSMVRSMPGEHLAEADRLLGSVHEALDPKDVVPGAPYVFDEPLGHYQHMLMMTERVLQFMGMAYMTDDDAQLDLALDKIDGTFWPIAERNLNVSALLDVGIRRGYGLDAEGFQHLGGKIFPIRDALFERLASNASSESPVVDASGLDEPRRGVDVVFIPENGAQAIHMIEVAADLDPSVRSTMLEINIVSGASGVTSVLDEHWTGERASLNEWTLSGEPARTVVVQWPYGPTSLTILGNAEAAGSTTVELEIDPPPVARLDESQFFASAQAIRTAAELSELVREQNVPLSLMPHRSDVSVAALAAVEEYPTLPADIAGMEKFHNRHVGERCVIIGNGPSLNELDLARLRDEFTVGVNGIFYAESITFPLSYYVVEDTSVMEENLEAIKGYSAGHKFFPTIYRKMYGEVPVEEGAENGVTFFTMNRGFYAKESPNFCVPRFSTDASQRLYCGQSVTIINLQLAYYMGFTEVYLIGMDFSYTIPDSAKVEGDLITSTEDDVNHFHKDYFGKGKTWKDPKLDRVMNNYQLAKVMFEADGRAVYNATAGGKLDIFERRDFHSVFTEV